MTGLFLVMLVALVASVSAQEDADEAYLVLATQRTGTMQDELSEAAARGYVLVDMFGGETAVGGQETVAIMRNDTPGPEMEYLLIATSRTSTLQDELNEAHRRGFDFRDLVVFNTLFGGEELVVIMERNARER